MRKLLEINNNKISGPKGASKHWFGHFVFQHCYSFTDVEWLLAETDQIWPLTSAAIFASQRKQSLQLLQRLSRPNGMDDVHCCSVDIVANLKFGWNCWEANLKFRWNSREQHIYIWKRESDTWLKRKTAANREMIWTSRQVYMGLFFPDHHHKRNC